MAGHSKWKTIRHKKEAEDTKRGRIFTKLLKEISVAARAGGGDPSGNPRLRFLLEKGREVNMPLDNAIRAIKKGTGELPGQHYELMTYEGYGPAGIALIIDVLTDNKNKAIAELRHAFSRGGGNIAEGGAVSWMFERKGVVRGTTAKSEEQLMDELLAHDLDDLSLDEGTVVITTDPKALEEIKQAASTSGIKIDEARLEWIAKEALTLEGEAEEKAVEFLQSIEDLEDVQDVYTNLA
jgi:YebC/PmpR family DNA-binding regulatory protein